MWCVAFHALSRSRTGVLSHTTVGQVGGGGKWAVAGLPYSTTVINVPFTIPSPAEGGPVFPGGVTPLTVGDTPVSPQPVLRQLA